MENKQVQPKSLNSSMTLSKSSTEQNQISQPTTWSEILETEHPFVRYKKQIILTEKWPDKSCQDCYGLGYFGVVNKEPIQMLKLGRNQPCVCKSGRKYKNCCSKRVEEYKQSQGTLIMCFCVGSTSVFQEFSSGVEEVKKELSNGK